MTRSETNESRTAGAGDAADSLQILTSALQNSLALGLTALQMVLSPRAGRIDAGRGMPFTDPPGQAHLVSAAAQACLVAAASSLRYWSGLSQILAGHQSGMLQSLLQGVVGSQLSDKEQRDLAEDFRACLREVSELSVQEARLLQVQLEELGERIAAETTAVEPGKDHRRRWKAKP